MKLADYMIVIICTTLYSEQCEEFYTCILKFVHKILMLMYVGCSH